MSGHCVKPKNTSVQWPVEEIGRERPPVLVDEFERRQRRAAAGSTVARSVCGRRDPLGRQQTGEKQPRGKGYNDEDDDPQRTCGHGRALETRSGLTRPRLSHNDLPPTCLARPDAHADLPSAPTVADLIRHGAGRSSARASPSGTARTTPIDEAAALVFHALGLDHARGRGRLRRCGRVRPSVARVLALFGERIGGACRPPT